MNDGALLRRYCEERNENAFLELARRHMGLVYSTAVRHLGNPEAARDVSQAVFTLLAGKAARLTTSVDLVGWLHRAACLKSREYLRAERRRRFHEHEAAIMHEINSNESGDYPDLAARIDETLNSLSQPERELVLWRFYSRLSWNVIAVRLGVSEDAARMRLKRVLEKLRAKLGLAGGVSVATLSDWLDANAVTTVPDHLASEIDAAIQAIPFPARSAASQGWLDLVSVRPTIARWLAIGGACGLVVSATLAVWPKTLISGRNQLIQVETPVAAKPPSVKLTAIAGGSAVQKPIAPEPAALLEKLRFILFSDLEDGGLPPQDLREVIAALKEAPDSTFEMLVATINNPDAPLLTRKRAVWGLWLAGEQSPNLKPSITDKCAAIVAEAAQSNLWWDAAQVLEHLSYPAGSIERMADAVWRNPKAGYATAPFFQGAAHMHADIVAPLIRPWLEGPDPLRFCAAVAFARISGADPKFFLPILVTGLDNEEQRSTVLRSIAGLGTAASSVKDRVLQLLVEMPTNAPAWTRDVFIHTLAAIAPETRKELPEVDAFLLENEAAEAITKAGGENPSLADLIGQLKFFKTAWSAALDLEEMGPAAADALPALRAALKQSDLESHRSYFSDAIKVIDPASPKPWFSRDDLSAPLRALAEVVSRLGPALDERQREQVNLWINGVTSASPETLVETAAALGEIHPRLRESLVTSLVERDPALSPLFANAPPVSVVK